jgi:hypothetical protein
VQAEISLPPRADIDPDSLRVAHEIRPDRLVGYLWPGAEGTKFDFQFRSRCAVDALTGASILYDYYNPESRATVQPVRFLVH